MRLDHLLSKETWEYEESLIEESECRSSAFREFILLEIPMVDVTYIVTQKSFSLFIFQPSHGWMLFENWIKRRVSKKRCIWENTVRFFQKERAYIERNVQRVTGNNYSLEVLTNLLTWLIAEENERSFYFARLRSSEEEHMENALASGAEEGRDKLRKAAGSCK